MEPSDPKGLGDFQEDLDRVAEELHIHTALTDAEGKMLQQGGSYGEPCARIRQAPDTLAFVCSKTNGAMIREARETGEVQTDLCEAGLFKTLVPIFRDGAFVGTLTACGLALSDEPPEPFFIAKTLGIDEAEAEGLIRGAKVVDEAWTRRVTDALAEAVRRRSGEA